MFSILFTSILGAETVVIVLVALLLFGGKRLPELMRGVGKGYAEFKKATGSIQDEIKKIDPTKDLRK